MPTSAASAVARPSCGRARGARATARSSGDGRSPRCSRPAAAPSRPPPHASGSTAIAHDGHVGQPGEGDGGRGARRPAVGRRGLRRRAAGAAVETPTSARRSSAGSRCGTCSALRGSVADLYRGAPRRLRGRARATRGTRAGARWRSSRTGGRSRSTIAPSGRATRTTPRWCGAWAARAGCASRGRSGTAAGRTAMRSFRGGAAARRGRSRGPRTRCAGACRTC